MSLFLASPQEENFRAVLEEKVAVLQVYWGEFPKEQVEAAHRAGVKVLHQVSAIGFRHVYHGHLFNFIIDALIPVHIIVLLPLSNW